MPDAFCSQNPREKAPFGFSANQKYEEKKTPDFVHPRIEIFSIQALMETSDAVHWFPAHFNHESDEKTPKSLFMSDVFFNSDPERKKRPVLFFVTK